jgi:hypothetical protein
MDYTEFLKAVEDCDVYIDKALAPSYRRNTIQGDFIQISWCTGGQTGGSCWNDGKEGRHYAIDSSPEPEFEALDTILEKFYPEISFMAYKRMVQTLIKSTDYCDNEYYGNYYSYAVKYVDLKELYEYLQEKGKV